MLEKSIDALAEAMGKLAEAQTTIAEQLAKQNDLLSKSQGADSQNVTPPKPQAKDAEDDKAEPEKTSSKKSTGKKSSAKKKTTKKPEPEPEPVEEEEDPVEEEEDPVEEEEDPDAIEGLDDDADVDDADVDDADVDDADVDDEDEFADADHDTLRNLLRNLVKLTGSNKAPVAFLRLNKHGKVSDVPDEELAGLCAEVNRLLGRKKAYINKYLGL